MVQLFQDDELKDYIDFELEAGQSAILCQMNKFSDGSPMYMKPFVILRQGYMFTRIEISKEVDNLATVDTVEEIFNWVRMVRADGKYPTKPVLFSQFMGKPGFSKMKVDAAINHLLFWGHMGVKFQIQDHPHASDKTKVIVLIDEKGAEVI